MGQFSIGTPGQNSFGANRLDYDNSELALATAAQNPQFGNITTAELQFSSTPGGWLSEDFKWTAGVYYYLADTGIDPITLSVSDQIPQLFRLLGLDLPFDLPLDTSQTLFSVGIVATDAIAGYGQITWTATEWLDLTVGARYQVEDRRLDEARAGLQLQDGTQVPLFNFQLGEQKTRRLSPKFGIELRPFANGPMLYASYQEATKSGTFNVINFTAAPTEVKPQDVAAYEIGAKGELLDGTLRYDLSAYHYDIENFQAQYISITSGGALNLYNAPRARSRGLEANILWQVFPDWNPGFALTAGVAHIDAKFTDFPNGAGYDETTGLFFGERALLGPAAAPRDFTGNDMTSSPKLSAVMGLNQLVSVPGGPLEFNVNASYNSGFFFDPQNTERGSQPEHVLVGARIGYTLEALGLTLSVAGRNLTNEVYHRARLSTDFGTASQTAPPRSVAVSLQWDI